MLELLGSFGRAVGYSEATESLTVRSAKPKNRSKFGIEASLESKIVALNSSLVCFGLLLLESKIPNSRSRVLFVLESLIPKFEDCRSFGEAEEKLRRLLAIFDCQRNSRSTKGAKERRHSQIVECQELK
uniref:Uncharacterized protein n=1 Tax=Pediastrum angulosum TaxID=271408 RepID=A0A2U8GHK7_9CHLO|nr:hypothetical protein [Pediastrum angulosum]AWI68164.1 hypothetical protein [Pediastrum angulosum]